MKNLKKSIMIALLLTSTVTWAAQVTILCNDKKTFTFSDLMDSPEEVGKEKCKAHDGYKSFTAQFASDQMGMMPPKPAPQKTEK